MKVTQAAILAAHQPITDATTVGDARKIQAAKRAVVRKFEKAALAHIQATEGRDLEAERAHWSPLRIETNAARTGKVTVRQYGASEQVPDKLLQTWIINKKELVK